MYEMFTLTISSRDVGYDAQAGNSSNKEVKHLAPEAGHVQTRNSTQVVQIASVVDWLCTAGGSGSRQEA